MFKFQVSSVTAFMRYSEFYQALHDNLLLPSSPRVLVFGCSTGEEIGTVHHFWPQAEVFACDIQSDLVEQARIKYPKATIFLSSEDKLDAMGRFDLVCANSVFCRHPLPKNGLNDAIPFSEFDRYCGLLSNSLKDGGFLMMYNSNYFFQDSSSAVAFTPINISASWTAAFVPRVSPGGQVVAVPTLAKSVIQEYTLSWRKSVASRDRLSSALFVKIPSAGSGYLEVSCGIPVHAQPAMLPSPRLPAVEDPFATYRPVQIRDTVEADGAQHTILRTYVTDFLTGAWTLHGTTYLA